MTPGISASGHRDYADAPAGEPTYRVPVTPELTLLLFAAWRASWTTEERALHSAGVANLMSPAAIATHLVLIKRERDQLGMLLRL